MPDKPAHLDLDKLLAHTDWIRTLARQLLDDHQLAEDVAQETWVAALSKPPRAALRPWLKAVALNLSRKAARLRARRREREHRAARSEVQSPRFQAHRTVVQAVDKLSEPYRTTVVLRYFESCPPRSIATQMGVPVATVRTRLRRARELLRGKLDHEFGGDGRTWALALAPLLPWNGVDSSAAAALKGIAIVNKKAIAAILLVLTGLTLVWWANGEGGWSSTARAPHQGAAHLPSATARSTTSLPVVLAHPRLAPAIRGLRARVQSPSGSALRDVRVDLVRTMDIGRHIKSNRELKATPIVVLSAQTNAEGVANFELPPRDWTGNLVFRAASRGWRSVAVPVQHTGTTLITCRPTRAVSVRIRDLKGPATATVIVSAVDYSHDERDVLERLQTDVQGRARFEAFPGDRLEVLAVSAQGCSRAWVGTLPGTGPVEPIELTLSAAPRAMRLVFGHHGEAPVAHAVAWLDGVRVDRGPSDDDGRMELVSVPRFRLREVEFRLPWLHFPLLTEDVTATADGSLLVHLNGFAMSRKAELRVLSPDGAPIQGALVGVQRHVGFRAAGQFVTDEQGEVTLHARRMFRAQKDGQILWRYATDVIVYAEGFVPLVVSVPDGKSDVRLQSVAHREVHVVDVSGAPVSSARVFLNRPPGADRRSYSIVLLADENGCCSVPAAANWSVRASAFSEGGLIASDPVPLADGTDPLRLEINAPKPFPFSIAVRETDGSEVAEPVHLRCTGSRNQSRDAVLTDGTWSESAIWSGHFRVRVRGIESGRVASREVSLHPRNPLEGTIELTLSSPWVIRIRPSGIPHGAEFHPWRARARIADRDLWRPATVLAGDGSFDVRLPHAGPWSIELTRGSFRSTLSGVRAVQTSNPPAHDIAFAPSATLVIDFGAIVTGRPRLMLVPLDDDGSPTLAKPLRKEGSWNRTVGAWRLPQGRYHCALIDGPRDTPARLWATTDPVTLGAGAETRLRLQPRTVSILPVLPPPGESVDWAGLTLQPEGRALQWLAQAGRLGVHVTDKGPIALLWPGTFVLRDANGAEVYRVHVREGDRTASLVPAR